MLSIQVDDKPVETVDCQDGQEIGLGFNTKVKKGLAVFKTVMLSAPATAGVKDPVDEVSAASLEESEDESGLPRLQPKRGKMEHRCSWVDSSAAKRKPRSA